MKSPKIIAGLSGGVDSAVAALLLKEQGFAVEGLFMKNWEEDDSAGSCSAQQDLDDAQSVCDTLKIPLHTINFATEYWDEVFEDFLRVYKSGKTPNPDILCNREIKFKAFLNYAQTLGASQIATGHYAKIKQDSNGFYLLKPKDHHKDQTYFLYALNQHALAHSLFPLHALKKDQIRALAKQAGFKNFDKKDSTGICFIGKRRFKTFLERFLKNQPGAIKTLDGTILGEHDGLMYHTIGQRQGLRIGGQKNTTGKPWYVADKDLKTNTLIVVQGSEHPRLFKSTVSVDQLSWINPHCLPHSGETLSAKIRYGQATQQCSIIMLSKQQCQLQFETPQRAVTPGQSAVFYREDLCLGGGIIE